MTRRQAVSVALVVTLGIGLHLAFRGLAGQLPQIFPNLAREVQTRDSKRTFEEQARLAAATADEIRRPALPTAKIVVKRSGVGAADDRPWWRPASLVRSSQIPLLPPPEMGGLDDSFPVPLTIVPAVEFWKKIYGQYTTDQTVFHDTENLEVIHSIIDFSDLLGNPNLSETEKKAIRETQTAAEVERIQATLDDEEARDRIRTQLGLKNRFVEGLQISGRYLPLFEEIFEGYGLPRRLTRLVFVESIFKERALSKVGAAGLWQFMTSTGRRYLTIDRLIDERYDPILATHAAARLMKKNYEQLGSWPLAINAYNTGAGHLLRAVEQLGTTDIGRIIREYRHPDYAFASRNFYPEFLAALELTENEERVFGRVEKEPLLEFDLVEVPVTMTFPEIARLSGLSLSTLQELHPAFAPVVFEGRYALPAGSEIRLPRGAYTQFAARFVEQSFGSGAGISEAPTPEILAGDKPYEGSD